MVEQKSNTTSPQIVTPENIEFPYYSDEYFRIRNAKRYLHPQRWMENFIMQNHPSVNNLNYKKPNPIIWNEGTAPSDTAEQDDFITQEFKEGGPKNYKGYFKSAGELLSALNLSKDYRDYDPNKDKNDFKVSPEDFLITKVAINPEYYDIHVESAILLAGKNENGIFNVYIYQGSRLEKIILEYMMEKINNKISTKQKEISDLQLKLEPLKKIILNQIR